MRPLVRLLAPVAAVVLFVLALLPGNTSARASSHVPYYENRTDPVGLLRSYYNAVNRGEYRRAYSYWETPASSLRQSYAQFARGYADTSYVALYTGRTFGEGAAGSTYVSIPTVLVATHTDRSVHRYYGCYVMRHVNPGISTSPEARYWHIYSGHMQVAPAGASIATLLARGCSA